MWDELEEHHSSKPYVWVAFFLLLLVMSSIFLLRPSIGNLPGGAITSSRNTPVVSQVKQSLLGDPLHLGVGTLGLWSVSQTSQGVYLSYLDGFGVELWGEALGASAPFISSRGAYLVAGYPTTGRVEVYHSRNRLVFTKEVPGHILGVSISGTGETVIAYTQSTQQILALESYLTQITSLGQETWTVALPRVEVLRVEQSADGALVGVLGLRLEGAKVKSTVVTFTKQGKPVFSKDFDTRPVDLVIRDDGGALAIATGQAVSMLDPLGRLTWKYDSGAELGQVSYIGTSATLLFTAERRSLLTFGQETIVGLLSENGKALWQHRTKEKVLHVATSSVSSNLMVATDKTVHLFAPDGTARWSLTQSWGATIRAATTDGRSYVVHSSAGVFLVRSN